MRSHNHPFSARVLLVALALVAVGCGSDGGGGETSNNGLPDLNNNDATGGEPDGGSSGDSSNNSGSDDDAGASNGNNDGCVEEPKTSKDFLNSCAPKGVERRAFDNEERLPSSYEPGKPLPSLN